MAKLLRVVLWTAVIVGALVGVLRLTVIRWWQLPLNDPYFEASISPSLRGGDWVILWRGTAPSFGDLVLCPEPKTNRPAIGRVVGEPGDHVTVEGASLTVNGAAQRLEGSCDRFHVRDPSTGGDVEQNCSIEMLGSHPHQRGNTEAVIAVPGAPPPPVFDVPNGQFFLVSDNRALPWDSREFGPVDRASCVETVLFRLVSKDGFFDVPNRLTLIR